MRDDFNKRYQDAYFQLVEGEKWLQYPLQQQLAEQQEQLCRALDRLTAYGHCYFVYDVVEKQIRQRGGIRDVFGYDDAVYTMKDYLDSLHPALKMVQGVYSTGFITALSELPANTLNIETTSFWYTQTIKHRNGSNLFVRRTLIPFRYTSDNRLLAWVNLFTLVNNYQVHPFKFQGCSFDKVDEAGNVDQRWYQTHIQQVIHRELTTQRKKDILYDIFNSGPRKKKEEIVAFILQILQYYQINRHASEQQMANNQGWKLTTVRNRCKEIVGIMKGQYEMRDITTAREVSDFLAEQGLLPL